MMLFGGGLDRLEVGVLRPAPKFRIQFISSPVFAQYYYTEHQSQTYGPRRFAPWLWPAWTWFERITAYPEVGRAWLAASSPTNSSSMTAYCLQIWSHGTKSRLVGNLPDPP